MGKLRTIIFDLSDVLVIGLTGIEEKLHLPLSVSKDEVLRQFRSDAMFDYLLGKCSEDAYLQTLRHKYGWKPGVEQIKAIIREHFKQTVPGSEEIIVALARKYTLILLSDHGREWAEYIEAQHPFLALFQQRFYSYNLHMRKNDPQTYRKVLQLIGAKPEECLFIDDRRVFLEAARQVGLNTFQFESSDQLSAYLITMSMI